MREKRKKVGRPSLGKDAKNVVLQSRVKDTEKKAYQSAARLGQRSIGLDTRYVECGSKVNPSNSRPVPSLKLTPRDESCKLLILIPLKEYCNSQ